MKSSILIGVISDTHGLLRPEAMDDLRGSDHILHAGDVGAPGILKELAAIAPVTAVRGNIDREAWAKRLPKTEVFEVGGIWIAVMEGDPLSEKTYNHVAFKVSANDLPRYRAAIEHLRLTIRESRPRIEGEGLSLYFYDFDNHLFELHTATLAERLKAYAGDH